MAADFRVLCTGYAGERVASTVSVALEGDRVVVIDPGMVPDRRAILDPLLGIGLQPDDVTDVVFSHHHPDHTVNAALFPAARIHDHWATYYGDVWESRPAEGYRVSPGIGLIETPGHTPQDVTTLIETAGDLVACTHLWWTGSGPVEDPYAADPELLHAGRARVLTVASLIVPGHGEPFRPGRDTPR